MDTFDGRSQKSLFLRDIREDKTWELHKVNITSLISQVWVNNRDILWENLIWNMQTGEPRAIAAADKPCYASISAEIGLISCCSPDGKRAFRAAKEGVFIYEQDHPEQAVLLEKSIEPDVLGNHYNYYAHLIWSRDGRRVATRSNNIHVWDTQTGKRLSSIKDQYGILCEIATFSPDGKTIACVGSHHGCDLWEADSGKLVKIAADTSGFRVIWVSRSGRRMANDSLRWIMGMMARCGFATWRLEKSANR